MAAPPPPPSLPPPPKRAVGAPPPPSGAPPPPAANGGPPPPPSLPPPPPRTATGPPAPASLPPPAPRVDAGGPPPPPNLPPPPPRAAAPPAGGGPPPPPNLPPPPPRAAAPPAGGGPPPPPNLPPPPPASKAISSAGSTEPPSASSSAAPSSPASPVTKTPAGAPPAKAAPPKTQSSASALPIRGDSAPPPTGTFERPTLRSVAKTPVTPPPAAAAAAAAELPPPAPAPKAAPMPPQSTPPAPRATATTTSGGVIPAAAAAPKPVASAPVPTSAPPSKSVPVAVVAPPHHSPDMWLQAWGQYTELAADERSSWAQLCQLEATAQQAIINQVRAFMAKADALLSSEAAGRLYLAQLDDTERLSTIGVPFLMGREMLLVAQHSCGPTTSGPSPDDVLSKLQTELTQLRESAVSERDHRDATDKERVLAWNAQNASMSNTIQQLQEHVRSALDAYKTHAFTSASVAAAKAAEQALERLQESQLAQKSGGTISDDAKRLAKVEFAKMRADARDTALRHTLREERDARDFVEEIQFVVRREFLNLFQAGVLKPLHRVDIASQPMVPPVPQPAAPPPPSVQLEAAATLASISPSRARGPSLGDTLRREATDIQRGRRFVQYFHVLGYDVDIAAVYSSKFVEHGFGFAVDLSVADAEAVLGIHSVCRDVCQEELQAMGIDSIGERRTFFSRVKQFDQQQQQQQKHQQHYQEEQPLEHEQDGFAVSRTASLPFHVDPYASPTHHHGHLSRHISGEPAHAPSPSPHRPGYELPPLPTSAGYGSSSPPRTAGVTVQSIHGYREKCLARLGQLDKQLSDAWTAARHAARKRRTYSHQEETDWEAAYGTAQASDAARVSAWIGDLSELEVACRTGHSIAPSELPVPFDHKTGSARSTLLERRISGKPCPRWWLRSDSSAPTSRGPSVPGGIILSTTPAASSAFPAWW